MAWIGPRRQEIQDPAFDVVARRPHRNHLTLNAWFAHHPWAARLPAGVRRRIQALWKALGLEDRVGSRIASVPCPDRTEVYLVRRGASVPSRFPGTSAADRSADLVATCGGLGHVPLAGATLASAVPVLAAYASWWIAPSEDHFRLWWGGIFLAASAGCLATERWAQRHYFARDPREVVLDETAGMALTLLFLPDGLRAASPGAVAGSMALAFLAFRFFDVFKVGVRWIDRRTDLPGGVLWDDLLAGVYAGCLTAGVTWLALRPGEAAGP
jgi:phosphatidylglycerophosphatase A